MTFWTGLILVIAATALVYLGLSLNGKTEHAADHGHGHDDHGHGGHH